ncbi:hypothetical protein B0H34DRAFT_794497 [Crassisporium funariophilum]|nr:hypothetical protein B0H34DRAFT_794497 [Crassisporium funariophilum]
MAGIICLAISAIILLPISLFRYISSLRSQRKTYNDLLAKVRLILHPPDVNLVGLLTERATSNERLIRALKLSNTFVSGDPGVHKTFVSQAHRLLNDAQRRGWWFFRETAVEAVQWSKHAALEPVGPFHSYIQNITLAIILVALLQVDEPMHSFAYDKVELVASHITTLWALSKKPGAIPPHLLDELQSSLRLLIPDAETFPYPLDFVIPAWETLWRVVASVVAYAHNDPIILQEFRLFHADPNEERFRGDTDSLLSAKGVITEAMRLHPPSKHIARTRRRSWYPPFITKVMEKIWPKISHVREYADVEALLRCEIWGSDTNEFKPQRHHHSSQTCRQQTDALLSAFGHGPLRCIAATWAPMAAAVIAAAILNELNGATYTLKAGTSIGGREGWNGWTVTRKTQDAEENP